MGNKGGEGGLSYPFIKIEKIALINWKNALTVGLSLMCRR